MWLQKALQGFPNYVKAKRCNRASKKESRRLQLELLETRLAPTVSILNGGGSGYAGLHGDNPPDTCGAAGPSEYIEVINGQIEIFGNKLSGTPTLPGSLDTFLYTTGGLNAGNRNGSDSTIIYDDLIGRFIIGDLSADIIRKVGDGHNNTSTFNIGVSKSNDPTTLGTADWNFYQINTTEGSPGSTSWGDYPGNPGYNGDAVVLTFNMFGGASNKGSQIVSIDANDLANGVSQANLHVYHNDFGAGSLRPTSMHDSAPGDPMWLIQNGDGTNVNVYKMTNVLSNSATISSPTQLPLPAALNYVASGINDPLNPDSSTMSDIDGRILKAAEFNNTIVATQKVAVGTASVISATVQVNNGVLVGGFGYTVGDTLTVNGGTFTTAATLTVATVDASGSVITVTVANPGNYSRLGRTIDGTVTGGTGNGAKFYIFFRGQLDVQWYAIDVSSGTPAFQLVGGSPNIGRFDFGPNTYCFDPGIDINAAGDMGFGFMESDTTGGALTTTTGGFVSTFVTARRAGDPAGTMQPVVLVSAGRGFGNIGTGGHRIGDFSGTNTDPANGTFWHVNEFGDGADGGTAIANFTAGPEAFIQNGVLVVTGTNAGDNVTLRPNPFFSLVTQVLDNGVDLGDFNNGSFSSINVFAFGGNDSLSLTDTGGSIGLDFFNVPVTYDGGTGTSSVFLDDSTANFSDTYTFTSNTVSRPFFGGLTYSNVQSLGLSPETGNKTINIKNTAFGTSYEIFDDFGTDTINLSDGVQAFGLENVLGHVTVFGNGSDAVNLNDQSANFGDTYTVTSSTVSRFLFGGLTYFNLGSLTLNAESGNPTINVQSTSTNTQVVGTSGGAIVNVGNAGSVQGIHGTLNIENPPDYNTITVDDSADGTARTTTLGTFTPLGDTKWGFISGLAPGNINYEYQDTPNLTIRTGNVSGNVVNVLATGVALNGVGTTNIIGNAVNTVNIGSNAPSLGGTLANIAGPLNVSNASVMLVDDSGDTSARTASITNNSITGLSPAAITYTNGSLLRIHGGTGGNTFDVQSTAFGTAMNLILAGFNTVNVGNAGSVQGILGALNIEDPPRFNTIVVDDSADTTARTVTLSTLGTNPADSDNNAEVWGQIVGLAPAHINYEYADTTTLTVNGGTGGNTFNVQTTGRPTALNTGAGNDTVNVAAGLAGALTVNGGGGNNTLVGPNVNDTWNITSVNGGTLDGNVTFSSIQNLTGGSANDTFVFSNGMGVTGTVTGGGGLDTLDYSLYTTGVTVDLFHGTASGTGGVVNVHNVTGSPFNDTITGDNAGDVINANGGKDSVKGGTGNDTFLMGATQLAGTTVTGGGGTDTLVGANISNTWTLTGVGAGNINSVVTYSGIANLVGGTGNDTFKFKTGGSVGGTINGGGGTDRLDYSLVTAPITVNLQTGAATFTGGFSSINNLIGGSAAVNTLIGANTNNLWTISGAATGNVNGTFNFSDIDALVGGTGIDVFAFTAAASKVTSIDGGSATGDWLDYSSYTAAVSVDLNLKKATGVSGTVSNIQNVHGGNFGNTLTGSSLGNILIGGSGTNTIKGGSGRSLLIADLGKSAITGGSGGAATGGDIMIGGTTSFDTMTSAHEAALQSILNEWQSGDLASDRFLNILNGSGGGSHKNAGNFLNWTTTVLDNGKANTLTAQTGAGEGVDWFFALEGLGHTKVVGRDVGDHTNNT